LIRFFLILTIRGAFWYRTIFPGGLTFHKERFMNETIEVVDVTPGTLGKSPCCGIKDREHEGYKRKTRWLRTYFEKGLRAKVLLTEKNIQFGYIEYLPGEYAWRGVEAGGYMFIHCLWTFFKKYQRQGYGKLLIQTCQDEARKARMRGVAVVAGKRPWLASSDIFTKNGFEAVGTAPPDYELLVKKFAKSAPDPRFKDNWDRKLRKYGKGLTILRASQCPHTVRFADKIAETARTTYKLEPRIVELKTYRAAQNAPTPYAAFAVIYNGQLLADHQISSRRFDNIMKKRLRVTHRNPPAA
jgi:hypothetical protein